MAQTHAHPRFPLGPPLVPDWRHRRAMAAAAPGGRLLPKQDDLLTKRAVRYLRRRESATTARAIAAVRVSDPEVHGAIELRNGPRRIQLELGGRLLAQQGPFEIAAQMGLREGEVAAYTGLFLDIPGRLAATLWIAREVIKLRLDQPPSLDQLVLLTAWQHGPHALAAMLAHYDRQADPAMNGPAHGTQAWRDDLAAELLLAVNQIEVTPANALAILKVVPIIDEMLRQRLVPETIGEMLARRACTGDDRTAAERPAQGSPPRQADPAAMSREAIPRTQGVA